MIIKVDMDAHNDSVTWDRTSWAPFLDAATSAGSCIFFKTRTTRIVSSIDEVHFISGDEPPKVGYLHVEDATDKKSVAASVSILDISGNVLTKLVSMRFSNVETMLESAGPLCYQIAWIPPIFAENPILMENILLVSDDRPLLQGYADQLKDHVGLTVRISSVGDMNQPDAQLVLSRRNTVVIFAPGPVDLVDEVAEKAHAFTWETARIVNMLAALPTATRLFVFTNNFQKASSQTALAHASLHGFARIAAQEYPDIWGGLVDTEGPGFPLLAIKYAQGQDVIRMSDGMPRIARLRPFANSQRHNVSTTTSLFPKPCGTYVVTGGFGDLGLEVLDFLSRKGARRIVVYCRSKLPDRREWPRLTGRMKTVVSRIQGMEKRGTTIYSVSLDLSAPNASEDLRSALETLSLPPVLGVVHAAGISEDGLIKDTTGESFARVFGPKVSGALALHKAFPPGSQGQPLDFFVLFSSIGQLVGTPGQAPYGAANAFLDALAAQRRGTGDNCIAFQWTAWKGMGLAKEAKCLNEELRAKGITAISCEDAFRAWEEADGLDTDHAVVTRIRVLGEEEPVPFPLVAEVVRRRLGEEGTRGKAPTRPSGQNGGALPTGEGLKPYLLKQIRKCLGTILHLDAEEIDGGAAIADLGVDSVVSAALRRELQSKLGIKMSPSLLWKVDTVEKLHEWAYEQLKNDDADG
ncbi:unnamed protein product [Periconia digitata]|uniref:Carrier domain-containing protein n=1 Tax=Periconia digitata TaxID=1303443 RepID=A0A9W4XIM1_9PLEO|nr:unnamed protein product [Periconia digitata]